MSNAVRNALRNADITRLLTPPRPVPSRPVTKAFGHLSIIRHLRNAKAGDG